jgi:hypothetical protein
VREHVASRVGQEISETIEGVRQRLSRLEAASPRR